MTTEVFVPDGVAEADALARTTHMGVVAHPDDLEILAQPGILDCFGRPDRWFCGVVVTDEVAGRPRVGLAGGPPQPFAAAAASGSTVEECGSSALQRLNSRPA